MSTARFFQVNLLRRKRSRARAFDWGRAAEYAGIALFLFACINMGWTLFTPVSAVGDWQARQADIPKIQQRVALFRAYDPFFPNPASQAGSQTVTSLSIRLFGTRLNEGSGLGSAIIATPDGVQSSFAVGDEVMPGVKLTAVAFDHVVITRGGIDETVFLDQSGAAPDPAAVANGAPTNGTEPASSQGQRGPLPGTLSAGTGIGFGPRMANGRLSGIAVSDNGPGFAAMGFRPGDVITQVNGRKIVAADDIGLIQQQMIPGARIQLTVERGGNAVPLSIEVPVQ